MIATQSQLSARELRSCTVIVGTHRVTKVTPCRKPQDVTLMFFKPGVPEYYTTIPLHRATTVREFWEGRGWTMLPFPM